MKSIFCEHSGHTNVVLLVSIEVLKLKLKQIRQTLLGERTRLS